MLAPMSAAAPRRIPRPALEIGGVPATSTTQPPGSPGAFNTADIAWERCQERAAQAFITGDGDAPPELWARALQIAEQRFDRFDPRLATSLTNQALVLRRQGLVHQADQMFDAAIEVWDESWLWVRFMTPAHPETGEVSQGYAGQTLESLSALAARGRAATVALADHDQFQQGAFDLWLATKPAIFSDVRRLLGAVLLIASKPADTSV